MTEEQTIVISFDKEATPEQMRGALKLIEELTTENCRVLIVGGRPNDR